MKGTLGGKFTVPFEEVTQFHKECLKAFNEGKLLYLSERVPAETNIPFRFFLDIDFDSEKNQNIPDRDILVPFLVDSVYKFCQDKLPDEAVISFRGDFKIHLNFPNLFVNKKFAKVLALHIRNVTSEKFPQLESKESDTPWKVVVDSSVYNSGLRTLVSRKREESENNFYKVHHKDGNKWVPQATTLKLLQKASIFVDSNVPLTRLKAEIKTTKTTVLKVSKSSQSAMISTTDPILTEMTTIFKDIVFTKQPVINYESHSISFPLSNTFCFIENRDHKSNHGYILLDSRGSRFRCHDPDCKGRDCKVTDMLDLSEGIQLYWRETFKSEPIVDEELKSSAIKDCKDNIKYFYPKSANDLAVKENSNMFVSDKDEHFGYCMECQKFALAFETYKDGWCLRCSNCNMTFPPREQLVKVSPIYGSLHQYFMKINLTLVQNNTTIINYAEETYTGAWNNEPIEIFHDSDTNEYFKAALSGTDNAISKLLVKLYGNNHHGSVSPVERWFRFKGHCWVEGQESYYTLKKIISDPEFLGFINQAISFYKIQNIQDDGTKKKIRHLEKLIENLQSNNIRTTILKDAIGEFYFTRPNFIESLNTKNCMVFENGLYDFDKMIFRDGTPNDYITMNSPCTYKPFDENDKKIKDVFRFLKDIFPDEDVREYMLKILSLCLTTDTSQQYFFVLSGSGGNGKSKLMTLLESCLGDYFGTAAPELITAKREKANQANESLASLEKSRVLIMSEASQNDIIQASLMKQFTGEDTISVRKNYGSQMTFKPKFKLLFICNEIPKMSENGPAVWRRVKVIDFPTRFVDNPDVNKPNERQKDEGFIKHVLDDCKDAFISVLIKYHQLYKEKGLVEPKSVSHSTEVYQNEHDCFPASIIGEQFVNEDEKSVIKSSILQHKLMSWAKTNLDTIPKSSVFKKKMNEFFNIEPSTHRFGTSYTIHGWKGYIFRDEKEERERKEEEERKSKENECEQSKSWSLVS